MKPTSEQKYNFINEHLSELKEGEHHKVVMEGRVYKVKYLGLESDIYLPSPTKEA